MAEDTHGLNENLVNSQAIDGDQPTLIATSTAGRYVEFNGTSIGTDPDSIYIWDFDDVEASTVDNPNIMITKDPTETVIHFFSELRKYAVRLLEKRRDGIILEAVKTVKVVN